MLLAVFATYALHAPSTPAPSEPRAAPRREHHSVSATDLYSARARRRFASYLRLRLLELREAGLERAAQAVERRLPVDDLVRHR